MSGISAGVLGVDLGKTTCRVGLGRLERLGTGFPGLAAPAGAARALAAISDVLSRFDRAALAGSRLMGIGAAGADSAPDAARELALFAKERWGWDVVVASDVVTAHLGAFDGGPGSVLIAGTGAVAYRIRDDGGRTRADGWGPWLGDEGSGRWIGQAGLAAALRAADGRGAPTSLTERAVAMFGDLSKLPLAVEADGDAPRRLAAFAPIVLDEASTDPVANGIVSTAIGFLVSAVSAVADKTEPIAVLGGLASNPFFLGDLVEALADHGFSPRRPVGSALAGAAILATRRDLLHERFAIRV